MGKYSLIVIGGFAMAYGLLGQNLNSTHEDIADYTFSQYERSAARAVANSMANLSLATLQDSIYWRSGYSNVDFEGNTGNSQIVDSGVDTTLSPAQVRIVGTGLSGAATDTVQLLTVVPFRPANVRGAITANSQVRTLGSLVVDGRDHDAAGNLLAGQGTYGVSTTVDISQSGGSKIGGSSSSGTDYVPKKPANPNSVEEYATYPFPSNPDDVYGYAAGTLKSMSQSGLNGGQYVTDPSALTFPLTGVTYVELGNGVEWRDIDFGASTGVLVVHNAWKNAKMKNLNTGTFKGLIIADDIEHIHMTITGAIVSLTTTPDGNCIGNGSGDVLYSHETIAWSSSQSGGGNGGVTVMNWLE